MTGLLMNTNCFNAESTQVLFAIWLHNSRTSFRMESRTSTLMTQSSLEMRNSSAKPTNSWILALQKFSKLSQLWTTSRLNTSKSFIGSACSLLMWSFKTVKFQLKRSATWQIRCSRWAMAIWMTITISLEKVERTSTCQETTSTRHSTRSGGKRSKLSMQRAWEQALLLETLSRLL